MKKNVVILGSTGSLGKQTIEVLQKYSDYFQIIGLSAKENKALLDEQKQAFSIPADKAILTSRDGQEGLLKLVSLPQADIVVNNLAGNIGIEPTIKALQHGKHVLIANKEAIVAEGEKIMQLANDRLTPLDSEHNAIFEILQKFPGKKINKIWLPCSGGPFWHFNSEQLSAVTVADALQHPKWKMGQKVSIESATLINKGLEIIEAHYLFNQPLEKIATFFHPECSIHGLVEFDDAPVAYYGEPDMKEHIENAFLFCLGQPRNNKIQQMSWDDFGLQSAINDNLPGINLVMQSFKNNRLKSFLAEEETVINKFLASEIKFLDIYSLLQNHA